ncbi:MAG: PAS domain-containing sensor histidine kinase [Deltaproteobacteria bacterium]|nr:PAS domain-containing sensor histidine kinase [Deltaproteobacteria bacterium]
METTPPAPTDFAPAERVSEAELRAAVELACANPLLQAVLDAFSGLALVLNPERQVIAVNDAVLRRLGFDSAENTLGLRPGELLGCLHAKDHPGGCGTSVSCALCGATNALRDSQRTGNQERSEFRLTVERGRSREAVEFEVLATPFVLDDHALTLLTLRDISSLKRVELLEHTFFHDVANTLSGIRGWNELLIESADAELSDTARRVHRLINRLAEQVEYQRAVWRAAAGELRVEPVPISVFELVEDLQSLILEHPTAHDRTLEQPELSTDAELVTDRSLLLRVLSNMLINAFEATDRGGQVKLDWSAGDESVRFSVWNDAVMAKDVALRVFERTFSTKADRGRGLGTYAMKLFGEVYLGGSVGFTSEAGQGTTFSIELPIGGPEPANN